MKKSKKENKKWVRFRHKVYRVILYHTLGLYSKLKYNVKIEKFKEEEDRPYLVLFNHQTAFDQFFVGQSFKKPLYFIASEDIFSIGWASSIIKHLVAPIPIKKQTTDVRAVLNCMRVVKEGGSVALAPEGNRTYSGKTEYMSPAIAPLARKLGVPIALYRLEGGYGVHPRWSDRVRRGKMRAYVSEVISPEEYAELSDAELLERIKQGLYVNEATVDGTYKGRGLAEYLERALYVCPYHGFSRFESHGDIIECLECGRRIRYDKTKQLFGVDFDFPYTFVDGWYEHQSKFVNSIDTRELAGNPLYTDKINFYEVIPYKKKRPIAEGLTLTLYGDKITLGEEVYLFDSLSAITILGKNKLNMYYDGKIYQMKGDKRFCALKYVHIFNRHKNIMKGDENVQFLGL